MHGLWCHNCAEATPGSDDRPGASGRAMPYISIVSKGFQHQFWQAVKKGAEDEAAKESATVNFIGPNTEPWSSSPRSTCSNAELAKKPAALCFAALDSKAAGPTLQKFADAKIPVIAFDSGVDSDIPLTTCTTDNLAAAGLAADKMAAAIGDAGEVGIVVHDQTSRTGIDRRDGFLNEMKAKHPNIKVVDVQYGQGDHLKSAEIAKTMLQAHPNLKGIFGANEGSAEGRCDRRQGKRQEGRHHRLRFRQGAEGRDPLRRDVRRDHPEPARHRQVHRRGAPAKGTLGRNPRRASIMTTKTTTRTK